MRTLSRSAELAFSNEAFDRSCLNPITKLAGSVRGHEADDLVEERRVELVTAHEAKATKKHRVLAFEFV
jgi:hypothetical protein